VLGKLFNSSEYLEPIYQMQKAVQARGLDVGLAAGYRYSRKGCAIQDNPHYCANSEELMDNVIT
jgi:hypothetical protein